MRWLKASPSSRCGGAKEGLSHGAYLYELVQHQRERREQRLLHQADLPPEKTFRTLELDAFPATLRLQLERLKSGAFLKESTNVIALGKPGVGKSHDLAAVAYELAHAGHPVLWTATSTQVQRLLAASTCAAWRVRT